MVAYKQQNLRRPSSSPADRSTKSLLGQPGNTLDAGIPYGHRHLHVRMSAQKLRNTS